MIVKWTALGMDQHRTTWCGMDLLLQRTGNVWCLLVTPVDINAALEVNGKQLATISTRWSSSKAAMEAIDGVMERLIRNRKVTAQQRPAPFIVRKQTVQHAS